MGRWRGIGWGRVKDRDRGRGMNRGRGRGSWEVQWEGLEEGAEG